MTGNTDDLIFPQSEIGQAMRWSKFKDKDARYIFDVVSKYAFPAVKKMKYGKLPDFDEKGEMIETPDCDDNEQVQTAFPAIWTVQIKSSGVGSISSTIISIICGGVRN